MDRILFGDNQFFGVNHVSDEKSRAQAIKFKEDAIIISEDIIRTIKIIIDELTQFVRTSILLNFL